MSSEVILVLETAKQLQAHKLSVPRRTLYPDLMIQSKFSDPYQFPWQKNGRPWPHGPQFWQS